MPSERVYAGPKVLPLRRCGRAVRGIRLGSPQRAAANANKPANATGNAKLRAIVAR